MDENYVKAYLRRAHYCEEEDRLDEALNDYKKILSFDPAHTESLCAVKVSLTMNYLILILKKIKLLNFYIFNDAFRN